MTENKNGLAHRCWPVAVGLTMNNVGHWLIEAGFEKIFEKAKEPDSRIVDVAYNWLPDRRILESRRPLILVSSSSLVSRHRPDFDQQGSDWADFAVRLLRQRDRPTLLLNIGVGGVENELRGAEDLSENALSQIEAMADHENLTVWAREQITQEILERVFQIKSAVLGCPSFALLETQVAPFVAGGKRIVLTGAAIDLVSEIEHKLQVRDPSYAVIQQSNGEHADKRDHSEMVYFRPNSLGQWKSFLRWFEPDLVLGTRLHGAVAALSLGLPAALFSGDIRSKGLSLLAPLPHFESFDEVTVDAIGMKVQNFNSGLGVTKSLVKLQQQFIGDWTGGL